jgi:ribonuclease BN (tRNA processing enzyme)
LLEAEGFRLVLDLGSGSTGALQRSIGLDAVDAVCLSHLHADHCLDLCPLWVARTFHPDGARPPIPVYGPEGTAHRMAQAYGLDEHPGMRARFSFETLQPGSLDIGPFRVATAHMNHPVETFGFRVEHQGRTLAYSADTGESEQLVDLARGADLLLCEASFVSEPDLPADLHLTARQAAGYAARADVGRLVLTHLVPWNDRTRSRAEAGEAAFDGEVCLAAAGDRYDLG